MFGLMRNLYKYLRHRKEKAVTVALLGIDNAGKSTVLACMKGEYQEFIAPTIGFTSEVIKHGHHTVKVFDLGGGANIRGIWTRYYADLHGAVFVVDASDRSKLPTARDVLHQAMEHPWFTNKPLVIMANKQDKAEPMSSAEIASNLGLEKFKGLQFQVIVCSALMEEGKTPDPRITQGLKWLISNIDSNYTALQKRIQKDTEQQKEEERIEREEKRKRVEARRRERELEREKQEKEEKEKGKMHTIVEMDEQPPNTITVITETPSSSKNVKEVTKADSIKGFSRNAVVPLELIEKREVSSSIDSARSGHKTPRSSAYTSTTIVVARQPEDNPVTEHPVTADAQDQPQLSARSKSPDSFNVQVQGPEDAQATTTAPAVSPRKSSSTLPPLAAKAKLETAPSPALQSLHPLPRLEKPAFV